jgi:hypothetical protein
MRREVIASKRIIRKISDNVIDNVSEIIILAKYPNCNKTDEKLIYPSDKIMVKGEG